MTGTDSKSVNMNKKRKLNPKDLNDPIISETISDLLLDVFENQTIDQGHNDPDSLSEFSDEDFTENDIVDLKITNLIYNRNINSKSSSSIQIKLNATQEILTPKAAFKRLFDKQLYTAVTNWSGNESHFDLDKYLGLLILIQGLKMNQVNIDTLWNPLYGPPIIQQICCSKESFQSFNKSFLCFNRQILVQQFFRILNKKLLENYKPAGSKLIIDKQSINGTEIYWLCDCISSYPVSGVWVSFESFNAFTIVKQLCAPFFDSNKTIILNEGFTDLETVKYLYKNGLTCVGLLDKSKRVIPDQDFIKTVAVASVKNGDGIFISTLHKDPTHIEFYFKSNQLRKPIYLLIRNYSGKRFKKRIYLSVFYNLIDIGLLASSIIYNQFNSSQILSKQGFLLQLAKELCQMDKLQTS